jgi:protein-S-isoprenylcysteine O-methyltransferase Ste14
MNKQLNISAGTSAKDNANVQFPPPLIHAVAILFGIGLASYFPLSLPEPPLLIWLGIVLIGVSLPISGSAFRQFRRSRNPVAPNQPISGLMTGGPFRFTRNPLYLALAMLHSGIALITANTWILLALFPALLLVRYYVIAREESYLIRRFGDAYYEYQGRVRRWI